MIHNAPYVVVNAFASNDSDFMANSNSHEFLSKQGNGQLSLLSSKYLVGSRTYFETA